jgi:hypothetical protein
MVHDIDSGFMVLAPAGPVLINQIPVFSWYWIHPETGETLGMSGIGEGADFVEYLQALKISLVLSPGICGLLQLAGFGNQGVGAFAHCVAVRVISGTAAPKFGYSISWKDIVKFICLSAIRGDQNDIRRRTWRGKGGCGKR